jgi:hypothetical protein
MRKTGKLGKELNVSYRMSLVNMDDLIQTSASSLNVSQSSAIVDPAAFIPASTFPESSTLFKRKKGLSDNEDVFKPIPSVNDNSYLIPKNFEIPGVRSGTCNAPFDIIHRISYYLRRQKKLGNLDPDDTHV